MEMLEAVFDSRSRSTMNMRAAAAGGLQQGDYAIAPGFKQQQQQQQQTSGYIHSGMGIEKQQAAAAAAEVAGRDELLAHAGYNVRASDLTHVAARIEELDSILGSVPEGPQLASDTVHYNPSDIAGWIEYMLDELGGPVVAAAPQPQHQQPADSSSEMESVVTNSAGGAAARQQQQLQSPMVDFPDAFLRDYEQHQHQPTSSSTGMYPNVLYAEQVDLGRDGRNKQQNQQQQQQQQVSPSLAPRPPSGSPSSSSSCVVQNGHLLQSSGALLNQQQQNQQQQQQVVSSEECGVRLVHLLLACANAVQRGELVTAEEMLRQLRVLVSPPSSSSSGAMGRVAAQFVEGLSRRIYSSPQQQAAAAAAMASTQEGSAMEEILHFHFYEVCPYLQFAHFTANQAILEAFEGHKQVHVVDFNLQYGLQWPALIQALALRPGGPPLLRLTGIGPPQAGGNDLLREIGLKLAQLAETVNVEFTFHGVVAEKLDDVKPWMLTVRRGEAVAVNSVFQLHKILGDGGGGGAGSAIDEVLHWVRALKPKIVTLVEQDADHNGPVFLDRFMAALHYYSTMFDSLEACNLVPGSLEQMVAETYLGREMVNIVACEGAARTERHETLAQWRGRMARAGFEPLYLGSNAFKQASMLLRLFSGDGYRVEENGGCLTLGWHSRPLVAASAWQCC